MKAFLLFVWSFIVIASTIVTTLSVLSSYIPPHYLWGLCFLNYALPFFLAFEILLAIPLIFVKEKFWWWLVGIIVGLYGMSNNLSWGSSKKDQTANYSILTYNIRLFDYYSWLNENTGDNYQERSDNGATLDKILHLLEEQNTDFICFQEFFNQSKGDYQTVKKIQNLGYEHVHVAYSFENAGNHFGIATFSKYPILEKSEKFFGENTLNNGVLVTDVLAGSDTLRIINLHFESFKLGKKDYSHINAMADTSVISIWNKPTKAMLKKIQKAFENRVRQVDYVCDLIESSPYPVVLCGDFNELPHSNLYRRISWRLKDSFKEVGQGWGKTFIGKIPALRIDYAFHSESLTPIHHEIIQDELSDHYPVLFHFKKIEK